jgi:hypothetical protein
MFLNGGPLPLADLWQASSRRCLELKNIRPDEDPHVEKMYAKLLHDLIPNELQAPLPPPLRLPQAAALGGYLIYDTIISNLPEEQIRAGAIRDICAYGDDF